MFYYGVVVFGAMVMNMELAGRIEVDYGEEREESLLDGKPDLLPKYCTYRDEGCDMAPSCLDCPLPGCILEQPGGEKRWLRRLRDREIVRLFTSEGRRTTELAQRFGVSVRTVQRVLRRAKDE